MRRSRASGFVITLEFLLVMAVVVLPIMLGLMLLARKGYTLYLSQREFDTQPYSRATVWDSSNPARVIGPALGYDPFEAPLVVFRDAATGNSGVALGVRPSRFTSYGVVFYERANCVGTAYVRAQNVTSVTTAISGAITLYIPPPGAVYQLQGASYAVGNGDVLLASTASSPGGSPVAGGVGSVWMSQDITSNGPCYNTNTDPGDLVTATSIITLAGAGNYTPPYRLAFPTPTAGSPLPCPTAECP